VSMVSSVPAVVNGRFEGVSLCDRLHTNKLAVCLGDGSYYDKHYDNSGGGDMRKLTAILYLQEHWTPEQAGHLRMFLPPGANSSAKAGLPYVDIEPRGGRLVVFWSDTMVHSVCESHATSDADHRWALTVWLHTTDVELIQFDEGLEALHFPGMGASAGGLEG
jgi:Rps23 Pro-64 3,4-dihydroxylase Tpa1-like proline 4-hydroxylase